VVALAYAGPSKLKLGLEEHDSIQFCFYCETTAHTDFHQHAALRGDREAKCSLEVEMVPASTHAWMFLVSANGKKTSATKYLGKLSG